MALCVCKNDKFRFIGELLWRGSAQGFPRGEAVTNVAL